MQRTSACESARIWAVSVSNDAGASVPTAGFAAATGTTGAGCAGN